MEENAKIDAITMNDNRGLIFSFANLLIYFYKWQKIEPEYFK